ncbi:MAG TPA: cellulase family glycosylhydrolase [Myxococcales bacterium]|nr:cellulase family glycosylhydrolase [Myxococcales bacterium]
MNGLRAVLPCVLFGCGVLTGCSHPQWNPDGGLPPAPANNPFVHQEGTRLVDRQGNEVSLRGVNLGGWLLWEGWMWGGGWQSESDMMAKLTELLGEEDARAFRERVRESYIREEDIAEIARLGFNSVRIPFNHTLLEEDAAPFQYRPEGWAVLDRVLDWCRKHDLLAVLDLHSAPGGQSWVYMTDPDPRKLWDVAENQDRTVALWRAIAERYADHHAVAGYDLLNEPSPPSGDVLFQFYRRIAAAIREVDDRHLIIVEGSSMATDFTIFESPVTTNQAYSFHMYTWLGDPRRDEIKKFREVSQQHGIPMWNGEYGENSVEMIHSTTDLYVEEGSGLCGFSFWSWKKVPGSSAYAAGITAEIPKWKKLIAWVANGFHARPTREEALQGMDEFIEATRLENGTVDRDLVLALGGTP